MRRFLFLIFGLIALPILACATLPWWLGLALPAFARSHGVTFARYETDGYTRFALESVTVRLPGVTFDLNRVAADSPLVWLARRAFSQPGPIVIGPWRATLTSSPAAPAGSPGGWLPLRARLRTIIPPLRSWLPEAELGPGSIALPSGELKVASARWADSILAVRALSTGLFKADATLALFPQGEDLVQLTAILAHPTFPARLTLASRAATLTGQFTLLDQPALLTADFDSAGWLPRTATLRADAWTIPGARVPLLTDYTALRGTVRLDWRDAQLTLEATATGEPAPHTTVPPLAADFQARSDGTSLRISRVHLTTPGLRADLTAPITIDRTGKLLSGDSRFTVAADLAAWPQLTAQGTLTGEARLTRGPAQLPHLEFRLAAKALTYRDWKFSALTAAGQLDWPQLTLTTADLESANGDRLTLRGGYDFSRSMIRDLAVSGRLARASLAPFLPANTDFTSLTVEASATGPLAHLNHAGKLAVTALSLPPLKPLNLAVEWQGLGRVLESFAAEATAGPTRVTASGAVAADRLTLRTFTLAGLQLTAPAELGWKPALRLTPFTLATPDATTSLQASFALGPTGQLTATVKNFASAALADLFVLPGPAWRIAALNVTGSWDHGPLTFTTTANAALALDAAPSADLTLAATGDANGIRITTLEVLAGAETAVRATGRLPFVLIPDTHGYPAFSILPDAPLALTATTEPTARFWSQLRALTGVEVVAPQLAAQLDGTWAHPRGTATLRAARLALDPARFSQPLPDLAAVQLDLTGDAAGLLLKQFSATLDGQTVRATGRLPVVAGTWTRLHVTPLAQLTAAAELHLEIPDADIAALARHLPDYLSPQGRLSLDLTLKPGGTLDGSLRLRAAASRPFGALGALQDINADLLVAGRKLTLRDVNAHAGGQPVILAGTIELPPGASPRLDLTLKGTNLPLVRQLGLLLRGDLDLHLTTAAAGATVLGGSVKLHDSLFLADVRDLLPSGERGRSARAPYFAVESAPFNHWRLDVAVDGDRFLRLRTALFTGVASAHFRLTGDLGDPLALGEATIDEGNVRLPFASFAVQQASLRLNAENPHDPALWLAGTTRRYGYDLRLELSGALSAPVLTFTSSPALDSKQVLLLVMTGQLPANSTTINDRQRATRFGAYLGQSLLGTLGGDDPTGDRLSIVTGERISQQGRETYAVEYRLDDRWSLVGEYDEFDDYNAGVKWRIFADESRTTHARP